MSNTLSYETKVLIRTHLEKELQARMEVAMRNMVAAIYSDPLTDPNAKHELLKFVDRLRVNVTVEVS